jgi:integrase
MILGPFPAVFDDPDWRTYPDWAVWERRLSKPRYGIFLLWDNGFLRGVCGLCVVDLVYGRHGWRPKTPTTGEPDMSERPRGQIIKRGGSYTVRCYSHTTPEGKKIYRNGSAPTKKDAEKLLTQMLAQSDTGTAPTAGKMTVATYLEGWKNSLAHVRQRTAADYASVVDTHLMPQLGHIRLADLSPVHLRTFYRALTDRGLSPRTVRKVHTILHTALERAARDGLIPRNVAKIVARDALPKRAHRELTVLDRGQARTFLTAVAVHKHGAFFTLLLDTGCRPEEAVALRWSDFDGANVRINRVYVLRPKPHYEGPKTTKSRRTIPVTLQTVALLERHRTEQKKQRLASGADWVDNGLIFCGPTGQPMRQDGFRKAFRTVLRRAGLPPIRMYDLRHTMATLALLAGVHVKVVSERLGHSTVALTLDVYSHVLEGMQESATAKLGAVLFG